MTKITWTQFCAAAGVTKFKSILSCNSCWLEYGYMSIIPDLDEAAVKRYLKDTNILTIEMSRTYKLSRPYQLKQFVHSMQCHPLPSHPSFVAVQTQCNPSLSTSPENVKLMFMILDGVWGDPVGGYCTCTVGWDMLYMYTDILLWSANHLCTFFRNHSF